MADKAKLKKAIDKFAQTESKAMWTYYGESCDGYSASFFEDFDIWDGSTTYVVTFHKYDMPAFNEIKFEKLADMLTYVLEHVQPDMRRWHAK